MPAFDATATLVHLLDLLAATGRDLASVVDALPPVFTAERSVTVEWARKGAVMREMVERSKGRDVVLVDGVKIDHGDGWVLVLPDPDDAVVRVLAEGADAAGASQLADHYARRIAED
jgi:mannose-1-phosphate guanylyltransferase/phosphomannomutase